MTTHTTTAENSLTVSYLTIVLALKELQDKLQSPWRGINERQQAFLARFMPLASQFTNYPVGSLTARVSNSAEVLNNLLKANGYDIRISQLPPNGLGVVAMIDLLLHWQEAGEDEVIYRNNIDYHGVLLKKGLTTYKSPLHAHEVLKIDTKLPRFSVFMTEAARPANQFTLVDKILSVSQKLTCTNQMYDSTVATFPMVDLQQQAAIDWLLGAEIVDAGNEGYVVTQALQENSLTINTLGTIARSGTALTMRATGKAEYKVKVINIANPFLYWIVDAACPQLPIYMAYLDTDAWMVFDKSGFIQITNELLERYRTAKK